MKQFFAWLASFGPMGLLGLSFVECLGIPNPGGTDFALVAFAAARPQDAFLGAMLASLGSILGSAIFFEITRKGGEAFLNRYTATARANKFRKWYRYYGLATVFISALVPIPILPLKVFAACAGAMGVARSRFLTVLGLARIPRYLGLAYLGTRLGPESCHGSSRTCGNCRFLRDCSLRSSSEVCAGSNNPGWAACSSGSLSGTVENPRG